MIAHPHEGAAGAFVLAREQGSHTWRDIEVRPDGDGWLVGGLRCGSRREAFRALVAAGERRRR